MRRGLGLLAAASLVGFAGLLVACSGSSKTGPKGGDCEPGALECDGNDVAICSSSGELTKLTTCSGVCSEGSCADEECAPNTTFCKDGSVWKCGKNGRDSTLAAPCRSGETCRMDDAGAECSARACMPGQPMCDGDRASKCRPDGSGAEPGGTDCTANDQLCYLGQCRDQACAPGEKLCQEGDVHLCTNSGTATSLLEDCAGTDVCDPVAGACVPRACDPRALDCDGSRIVECDESGSGWSQTGTDCASEGLLCVAGKCQTQLCTPNGTLCVGGNVHQCNAAGTEATFALECPPLYSRCEELTGGNVAQCVYHDCTPNLAYCLQNAVFTCTAAGKYSPTSEDCGSENYCDSGACKPRVCTPFEQYCKDGNVWQCNDVGSEAYAAEVCGEEAACRMKDGIGRCVPLPCLPGSTACLDNAIGTCNDSGSALGAVEADCAANGDVCTVGGTCAASVEDVLGVENELSAIASGEYGNTLGTALRVKSARTITELEANLVLVTARDLRFVIYEEVDGTFIARFDKVVANQEGSRYFSSGPIDYTLKAGQSYLFAVSVTGGKFGAVHDEAPWGQQVSFGQVLGGYLFTYATSFTGFPHEFLYQMRITSELP